MSTVTHTATGDGSCCCNDLFTPCCPNGLPPQLMITAIATNGVCACWEGFSAILDNCTGANITDGCGTPDACNAAWFWSGTVPCGGTGSGSGDGVIARLCLTCVGGAGHPGCQGFFLSGSLTIAGPGWFANADCPCSPLSLTIDAEMQNGSPNPGDVCNGGVGTGTVTFLVTEAA